MLLRRAKYSGTQLKAALAGYRLMQSGVYMNPVTGIWASVMQASPGLFYVEYHKGKCPCMNGQ